MGGRALTHLGKGWGGGGGRRVRSPDRARGEAERAGLGRQSPHGEPGVRPVARDSPGGPAPSPAASFAGAFPAGLRKPA